MASSTTLTSGEQQFAEYCWNGNNRDALHMLEGYDFNPTAVKSEHLENNTDYFVRLCVHAYLDNCGKRTVLKEIIEALLRWKRGSEIVDLRHDDATASGCLVSGKLYERFIDAQPTLEQQVEEADKSNPYKNFLGQFVVPQNKALCCEMWLATKSNISR